MVNEKVEDLLNRLFKLKYRDYGDSHDFSVILRSNYDLVRNTVEAWYLDSYNAELAQLQAKVFLYEEIIKKSTFAPLIEKKEDGDVH